ncbi:MAG: phosphoglycerate dehydrogenase [Oscillospiraceae bacterium]|nr:MAG: phosphoglycerate dehydrogenase [Oscillospiraceae bacterium]
MRALIIDRVSPVIAKRLKEYGVEVDTVILPSREELKRMLPDYDLLVMRVDPKMDREMLDAAAGRVRMIAVCSAGTNHIDLEYAKQLGIVVQNAPGQNANAVAELTISKMLDLSRMTVPANEEVQKHGIWNKYKYTGHELRGHVLGIIGFGMIGKRVGQLAQAFGMKVLAYDPYLTAETCEAHGAVWIPVLDDLLKQADYISVHCPMTDETRGLLSEREFGLMKPNAIVINCARGGILDENAAAQALRAGKIGGIGLDVLSGELAGKGLHDNACLSSPLFGMENVLITPHIGGSAHEAYDAIGDYVVEKAAEYYSLNR